MSYAATKSGEAYTLALVVLRIFVDLDPAKAITTLEDVARAKPRDVAADAAG